MDVTAGLQTVGPKILISNSKRIFSRLPSHSRAQRCRHSVNTVRECSGCHSAQQNKSVSVPSSDENNTLWCVFPALISIRPASPSLCPWVFSAEWTHLVFHHPCPSSSSWQHSPLLASCLNLSSLLSLSAPFQHLLSRPFPSFWFTCSCSALQSARCHLQFKLFISPDLSALISCD